MYFQRDKKEVNRMSTWWADPDSITGSPPKLLYHFFSSAGKMRENTMEDSRKPEG